MTVTRNSPEQPGTWPDHAAARGRKCRVAREAPPALRGLREKLGKLGSTSPAAHGIPGAATERLTGLSRLQGGGCSLEKRRWMEAGTERLTGVSWLRGGRSLEKGGGQRFKM